MALCVLIDGFTNNVAEAYMKKIFFLLLLVLIIPTFGQENDTTYKYWMTLGTLAENYDFTFHAGYCFSIGSNFYKAGYYLKGNLLPGDNLDAEPGRSAFRSFSALMGKRTQSKWFAAYAFGGLAYVDGSRGIKTYGDKKIHTIGLQTEVYLLFRIANEIGVGVSGMGNVNATRCFVASAVTFTIGNGK